MIIKSKVSELETGGVSVTDPGDANVGEKVSESMRDVSRLMRDISGLIRDASGLIRDSRLVQGTRVNLFENQGLL